MPERSSPPLIALCRPSVVRTPTRRGHRQRSETTLLRAVHRSYGKVLGGSAGRQRQQRAHTAVVWLLGAQRRLKIY